MPQLDQVDQHTENSTYQVSLPLSDFPVVIMSNGRAWVIKDGKSALVSAR